MSDITERIVWHKVEKHVTSKEERDELIGLGWCEWEIPEYMFESCEMPENGQEILLSTDYGVVIDICDVEETDFEDYSNYTLEDRGGWDDVRAWAAMPKGVAEDD